MKESVLALVRSPENREKILIGLNLYGYDYAPRNQMHAVIGKEYLKILEDRKGSLALKWLEEVQEHVIEYQESGVSHQLFYPTLKVFLLFVFLQYAKLIAHSLSVPE